MMLMHPFLDIEYQPKLRVLLGGFNIYDREETLGEELKKYNPNLLADREILIYKHIIKRNDDLNYRHIFVLSQTLERAVEDDNHDFEQYFEHDPESHSALPLSWDDLKSPREFYEDILRLFRIHWKDELEKAAQEDPSTW